MKNVGCLDEIHRNETVLFIYIYKFSIKWTLFTVFIFIVIALSKVMWIALIVQMSFLENFRCIKLDENTWSCTDLAGESFIDWFPSSFWNIQNEDIWPRIEV